MKYLTFCQRMFIRRVKFSVSINQIKQKLDPLLCLADSTPWFSTNLELQQDPRGKTSEIVSPPGYSSRRTPTRTLQRMGLTVNPGTLVVVYVPGLSLFAQLYFVLVPA